LKSAKEGHEKLLKAHNSNEEFIEKFAPLPMELRKQSKQGDRNAHKKGK
jgi:hypothetical protein